MDEILITVDEFRKTMLSRRNFPVSSSYIYRLIKQYEGKIKTRPKIDELPFEYRYIGKGIKIVKPKE